MRKRAACGLEEKGVGRQSVCGERTSNIFFMLVTLDVSRVSGWLNAFATCAESKGSHEKEGGMCVPSCSVLSRKGHI